MGHKKPERSLKTEGILYIKIIQIVITLWNSAENVQIPIEMILTRVETNTF
jgi:hypothetical protein